MYGRRRIGKSSLVSRFLEDKPLTIRLEGLEQADTAAQIEHCRSSLSQQLHDPYIDRMMFEGWESFFNFLTDKFVRDRPGNDRLVVFLDELQWLAVGRAKLVSILKYFWDNHWSDQNVMVILCGSIASFMVRKVIKSKALYGRIGCELLLSGLSPSECTLFFRDKRSPEEQLRYMLIFGGVPKYLEEIDLGRSFRQNINNLCFRRNGIMVSEGEKVFYSQFKEARTYLQIVHLLKERICSLAEISRSLGIASGGSLASYLRNLEDAEIISQYIPIGRSHRSKLKRYALSDAFLRFYFKFMEPHRRAIQDSRSSRLFENLCGSQLEPWLGFAFERFCLKHADRVADAVGCRDELLVAAPYFDRGDDGFQVDLVLHRADRVYTLCEIKYHGRPITTKVIPEVKRKCALLPVPKGHTLERALISLHGADESLRNSDYFHHDITLSHLLQSR